MVSTWMRLSSSLMPSLRSGLVAINYVEGATTGCSASGNADKHVPVLYLWGADDRAHCAEQVEPFQVR
jgi:hypothetical protein